VVVIVIVGALLLVGKVGKSRRGGSGKRGRGGGLGLLVLGLLIGATLAGSDVVRSIVRGIVHAITTIGGLFS
jgi:hypothetical protein